MALMCYVDSQTNTVYTAILGTSEANIYRQTENALKSIPLSRPQLENRRKTPSSQSDLERSS